jgi:anti-sigma factor RsiW
VRQRNRFAYVAVPDEERRYDALASAELRAGAEAPSPPAWRARGILLAWIAVAAAALIGLKVKGAVFPGRMGQHRKDSP